MESISLNQKFDEFVNVTLAEKKLISNDSDKENNPPDMTDESAKSHKKNQVENIQLHVSNKGISSPIFHMSG